VVVTGDVGAAGIDWPLVVRREITVHGRSGHAPGPDGRPALAAVRDWLADPAFPVDGLVTHRFPLEQHEQAINLAAGSPDNGGGRVVFVGPASTMLRTPADEPAARSEDHTIGLLGRLRGLPTRAGSPNASE